MYTEAQMGINKSEILQKLCYSGLVYGRINKKLRSEFSKSEIETLIIKLIEETSESFFEQRGKNVYITNREQNIRITVNLNTLRVITVDLID
jgi:hypothetical protein